MAKQGGVPEDRRLPNYVNDVNTASCVFCPYGAEVKAGDQVYVYDEKTSLARQQRDLLVQVTAVKTFRSNGRVVTLDLKIATEEELAKIADDSEMTVQSLLDHHAGAATYDAKRSPVVVYFKRCDLDGAKS